MGAICGIVRLDSGPIEASLFDTLHQAHKTYGPHGSGSAATEGAAFGHHKVVSTPEGVHERLPALAHGSLLFTADARLDNREELLHTLGVPGSDAPMTPDTSLILMAYEKWGAGCVHHLRGDFAFALWDARQRTLLCCRDQFGQKPLYFREDASRGVFAFASSPGALLAMPGAAQSLNERMFALKLLRIPLPDLATIYEGVQEVPPAHTLTVTQEGTRMEPYWSLADAPPVRFGSDAEYEEAFLHTFTEAVRTRIRGNADVGVLMSAGFDSGAVGAVAASLLGREGRPLHSYTYVPSGAETYVLPGTRISDETPYVRSIAEMYSNIDATFIETKGTGFVEPLLAYMNKTCMPVASPANIRWMSLILDAMQTRGISVALTGQAGNMTLSWLGTQYLEELKHEGRLLVLASEIWHQTSGSPLKFTRQMVRHLLPNRKMKKLRESHTPQSTFRHSPFSAAFKDYVLTDSWLHERMAEDFEVKGGRITMRGFLPFRFLNMGKRVWPSYALSGSAYGLDHRDPTADLRFVEFCTGLPEEQFFRKGVDRRILRAAFKGILPDKVRLRNNRGLQGVDSFIHITEQREELRGTLATFRQSPEVCRYFDLDWMEATLDNIKGGEYGQNNLRDNARAFLLGLGQSGFLWWFQNQLNRVTHAKHH